MLSIEQSGSIPKSLELLESTIKKANISYNHYILNLQRRIMMFDIWILIIAILSLIRVVFGFSGNAFIASFACDFGCGVGQDSSREAR